MMQRWPDQVTVHWLRFTVGADSHLDSRLHSLMVALCKDLGGKLHIQTREIMHCDHYVDSWIIIMQRRAAVFLLILELDQHILNRNLEILADSIQCHAQPPPDIPELNPKLCDVSELKYCRFCDLHLLSLTTLQLGCWLEFINRFHPGPWYCYHNLIWSACAFSQ